MKSIFVAAGLLILLGGCSKSATTVSDTKNYSGTFLLNDPLDIPVISRVHIAFTGVNFTGSIDSAHAYVGNGVYKLQGDTIYFTQTGNVPQNVNKSGVLEGNFFVAKNNDSLVFSRKANAGSIAPEMIYRLQRD